MDVILRTAAGAPLNARVEADDRGLVVHSRSGSDRNRDYREAVEMILSRLDTAGVQYDVYLDSRPAQVKPLASRRLTFSRAGPLAERFNALVRAMNAGSSSNGAWRRVLVASNGLSPAALAALVRGAANAAANPIGRLPASDLRRVTNRHVDRAVARLIGGEDAQNFDPSRDFDLLVPEGKRLAPKKVFGLALEEALGINARPEHFSAGLGTACFQILEMAGYPIVRKDEVVPGNGIEPVDPDLAAAEGERRLVTHLLRERKPALANAKRRAMMAELGYLQCERCGLVPSRALGLHGDSVIEVHHAVTQVAEMDPGHITRLEDLTCLCANCHRIVHREMKGRITSHTPSRN